MANQQSLSVNDYVFAKPRAADGRGSKRGSSGGSDRGRNKYLKNPLFDAFRRPMAPPPPPPPRSPYHPSRGSLVGSHSHPPRHRPPLQPPPHQRGAGPGPPSSGGQSQQQPPPSNFQFTSKMPIPTRPLMTSPPPAASSSYPPSSSFPPSFPPPIRPPPTCPPPTFGGGVGGFPTTPRAAFFHPHFNNVRHPHVVNEGHHNIPGKLFHDFHLSKRGHHQQHHNHHQHNNPSQGIRAKCKKNYRPYNKPRFCKKRGRGAASLARAIAKRSKAPSNSALTTSFIMSDYYRQEAVASPDLRGNAGTHPIPDPVSIPICCCENDKQVACDACLNVVHFDEDHDDPDIELTDDDCDCPDCYDDAAATYDFMKCDFEQVFSEEQERFDSKEATAEADKFS